MMRLLAALGLLCFQGIALSQEPATLKRFEAAIEKLRIQAKAAIQRIESQAEVQRKEVEATFGKEVETIRKDFLAKIEEFQVQSTKDGDLDSALTARDEKQKVAAMKIALANNAKPEGKIEEATTETRGNKSTTRVKKLGAADFVGAWVNHVGKRLMFRGNGTVDGGYAWSFDAKTNTLRVVGSRSAWEYKVYLDGKFMDGVAIKGPEGGRRVWLVKVR